MQGEPIDPGSYLWLALSECSLHIEMFVSLKKI